jgi:hypothetical protein
MILMDSPSCAALMVARVLFDRGYSVWTIDPPEVPGHVSARLEVGAPDADGRSTVTLKLYRRKERSVLSESSTAVAPEHGLDYLDAGEAEDLVAQAVDTPAFDQLARSVTSDAVVRKFRIVRPDLGECESPE